MRTYVGNVLVNTSPPKLLNRSDDDGVQSNILCDLDPKVNGEIMYFLVNASPP